MVVDIFVEQHAFARVYRRLGAHSSDGMTADSQIPVDVEGVVHRDLEAAEFGRGFGAVRQGRVVRVSPW